MLTLRGVALARAPEDLVDVVIERGHIAEIREAGSTPSDGKVVDGEGRLAMAGFVDAHVHGEAALFDPDVQLAMLRQGITTVVLGQDGVSFAPTIAAPNTFEWATNYFTAINGSHPTFSGGSVEELLKTYQDLPINTAYLAPHGTIRHAVMGGEQRAATPGEVAAMSQLLNQALEQGACGISTGLEYAPSGYADRAELVELTRVTARYGLPHVSHMRGYETKSASAVEELVQIAIASGVKTHISHYHGPGDELLALVDDAHARGVDLTFDSYPYLRGCSILSMLTMPEWIPVTEPTKAVEMLRNPEIKQRLLTEHLPALDDVWPRVTLAAVPGKYQDVEGQRLVDLAAQWRVSPAEAAIELLANSALAVGAVFEQPPTNSAESVAQLLRHPSHMGGSDAIYAGGHPHPRGWGAFAKFLADHVRSQGDWTWSEAERHLASASSDRFNLNRGKVAPQAIADLSLIDPDTVTDRATYDAPRRVAHGIDDVFIAGEHVLADGKLTGHTPGRAITNTP